MATDLRSRTTAPAAVLTVRGLSFGWPPQSLFDRLSFEAPSGVGLVLGDDGCGKSTLLALLAGALKPHAGELFINGVPLGQRPDLYRQQVFWIDPHTEAHHHLTPTAYWDMQQRLFPAFKPQHISTLVEGFALQEHVGKPLYMLSTGSRRKVWWVAALACAAPLVLMDQPFAALDVPSVRLLMEVFQEASEDPQACWLLTGHEAPPGLGGGFVLRL